MKLIIGDKKYPLEDSMRKASLNDLYVLKVKAGIGIKGLQASLKSWQNYESHLDMLDEAENINALRAVIWLCRRAAGEFVEFEEASAQPMSDFGFEKDEEPEDEGTDPKAEVPDSGPDEPAAGAS